MVFLVQAVVRYMSLDDELALWQYSLATYVHIVTRAVFYAASACVHTRMVKEVYTLYPAANCIHKTSYSLLYTAMRRHYLSMACPVVATCDILMHSLLAARVHDANVHMSLSSCCSGVCISISCIPLDINQSLITVCLNTACRCRTS